MQQMLLHQEILFELNFGLRLFLLIRTADSFCLNLVEQENHLAQIRNEKQKLTPFFW